MILTSLFSSDLLIQNRASKKGIAKTKAVYFIDMENPKAKEYKKSLVIEYFLPISCPKAISKTASPNRILLGET